MPARYPPKFHPCGGIITATELTPPAKEYYLVLSTEAALVVTVSLRARKLCKDTGGIRQFGSFGTHERT